MQASHTNLNLSCMQAALQALLSCYEACIGAAMLLIGWSMSHLWRVTEEWLGQVQAGHEPVQHMPRGSIPQGEGEQRAAAGRVQAPGIVAEQQLVLRLHLIPAKMGEGCSAQGSRR